VSPDTVRDGLQTTLGAASRLDRELGGGGMSRVFVAEETSLGRTVVIKLLSPELSEGLNVDTLYSRDQPAVARAYADSMLQAVARSTLAGPLAWNKAALTAFGYAAIGDRAQAMRGLAQVHAEMAAAKGLVLNDSAQRYQDIAGTFAFLGDADSSAAYVKALFRLPGGFSKFTVRLDPMFDPVRNSPAFQRLLQ
jgi:hypothetical protein